MRSRERIPATLARLAVLWERYPDMRLGQLLLNAREHWSYYTEDDDLVKALEDFYADATRY